MYAIILDLDFECLEEIFENGTSTGVYRLIESFMYQEGFSQIKRGLYFGGSNIDAVKCVLTMQKLAKTYTWVETCTKNARMLRIEEDNDLLVAIK